ncbi:tetratricopeptide repeat protein 32-like [Pocillopora damicornis]|uniref:tetratricopeptide repeat protein 32-like n=1 Tax=Pocillopora damicornis TaxID=46731 RepID=UPI000F54FC3C|nr:tetratricopeptide repeat protein 32-like [Pocillopora damicornis]
MADVLAAVYDSAKLLRNSGYNSDALKELNKLIDLSKKCKEQSESLNQLLSRAWNDRGHLKYLKVDFDAAIYDYTQAIELDKNFAVPYYNRGQIHYRMGRYEEAVKDLRQALRIDPNFEDARQNLEQAIQDWNLNPK